MTGRNASIAISVWGMLTALFAAPNPALAADSWNKVESPHFLIVGEVGQARLKVLARTLEQFRVATTRMFPERNVEDDRPLRERLARAMEARSRYRDRWRGPDGQNSDC